MVSKRIHKFVPWMAIAVFGGMAIVSVIACWVWTPEV